MFQIWWNVARSLWGERNFVRTDRIEARTLEQRAALGECRACFRLSLERAGQQEI